MSESMRRLRRVPQQSRSRDRVEKILDAAAAQVVANGVDSLGTRTIAEAAGVPVASLYQYFADKDDILLALVERDLDAMDALVRTDVRQLGDVSIAAIVRTTMQVFADAYRERPAFVAVWMRGRSNPAIREYTRQHNRRVAARLYEMGREAGLFREDLTPEIAEVAVEIGDRLFEWAFAADHNGLPALVEEGIRAVTAYLELYAAPGARKERVAQVAAAEG